MTPAKYKSERVKRGLSQAALAELVGVARGTINYREAGQERYPITIEAWRAIQSLPLPKTPRSRKRGNDEMRDRPDRATPQTHSTPKPE